MYKDTTQENWKNFLNLCMEMDSPDEMKQLFDLFLTIEEKETLASRYIIVKKLLEEAQTQREIAQNYKVSIAQITRGSNALKIISPELREKLKQLLQKK